MAAEWITDVCVLVRRKLNHWKPLRIIYPSPHVRFLDARQTMDGDRALPPETNFSMTANVLCAALVVFYEDEFSASLPRSVSSKPPSGPSMAASVLLRSTMGAGGGSIASSSSLRGGRRSASSDSSSSEEDENQFTGSRRRRSRSTSRELAGEEEDALKVESLPGSTVFFERFSGRHVPSSTVDEEVEDPSVTPTNQSKQPHHAPCGPMRIDRADVDRLGSIVWIAGLRDGLCKLAAPRDHIW